MTPHTSLSFQVVEVCVTLPYLHGTWCYIHPSSIPFQIRSTKIKTTLSNKHGIVGEKQIASTSVKTMHDPACLSFRSLISFLPKSSHPGTPPTLQPSGTKRLPTPQRQRIFQSCLYLLSFLSSHPIPISTSVTVNRQHMQPLLSSNATYQKEGSYSM